MSFIKVEDDEYDKKPECSGSMMAEKCIYDTVVYEEDNNSVGDRPKFAVVTLQDTDEVMVVASNWLSMDKTQCDWPPFKSREKFMNALRNRLEPSIEEKPWEKLNVNFQAQYDTYKEAVNKQEEQRALKNGQVLYGVVTLQKSNELTVIPAMWLNEEKTQCYWPPYKSPEMCTEAVKYRHEPAKQVEILWEMLNTKVHMECMTFEQAKEKQNSLKRLRERYFLK
ncbi:uncharacterized protein [Paramisgurnus dabryanus]|uniref:uncharacterized protein n=1 Tax=Paramisgurnus dabryanus TaxID=90735 RepID=UPI0031F393CF